MTRFEVFVKGRETPVAATAFQAPAEEEARVAAAAFGRDAYVVDRSKSVYDPPVYKVKA